MDVDHKKPPLKTLRFQSEEGPKLVHVRKEKRKKSPLTPTDEVLKCPYCGEEHAVLACRGRAAKTRGLKTFDCPVIGHPLLYLKQEGQDYLRSLVVGNKCPPTKKAPPVKAPEDSGELKVDIDNNILDSLREAINDG